MIEAQQSPSPTTENNNILRFKIDTTDIFIEELGENKGKITVSDTYGHNYSMFWGAMGGTLKDFICRINSEYFVDKLLGAQSTQCFDVKATFKSVRKYIREEMGLAWYQHQEFQKQMRETLNDFQEECEESNSENHFVDRFFSSFIDRLHYFYIKDNYERERIEKDFKSISEQWNFIHTKENQKSIWLKNLHTKLKQELSAKPN